MDITVTFEGKSYTGSVKAMQVLLKKLAKGKPLYTSDTNGQVFIEDMNTNHIRNAILKKYRAWVAGLSDLWGTALLTAMSDDPTTDDVEFRNLLLEYVKRIAIEEVADL
jgi:hypothetical protein